MSEAKAGKPYGETYACCKHCEGQNCDPPNQHLSGCAMGCGKSLYTLSQVAKASQAEAEADKHVVWARPRLTNAQAVFELNRAAQARGRWFW